MAKQPNAKKAVSYKKQQNLFSLVGSSTIVRQPEVENQMSAVAVLEREPEVASVQVEGIKASVKMVPQAEEKKVLTDQEIGALYASNPVVVAAGRLVGNMLGLGIPFEVEWNDILITASEAVDEMDWFMSQGDVRCARAIGHRIFNAAEEPAIEFLRPALQRLLDLARQYRVKLQYSQAQLAYDLGLEPEYNGELEDRSNEEDYVFPAGKAMDTFIYFERYIDRLVEKLESQAEADCDNKQQSLRPGDRRKAAKHKSARMANKNMGPKVEQAQNSGKKGKGKSC